MTREKKKEVENVIDNMGIYTVKMGMETGYIDDKDNNDISLKIKLKLYFPAIWNSTAGGLPIRQEV